MISSLPNFFKFKIGRVLPSNEICTASKIGDYFVTEYIGAHVKITKTFTYREALECVNDGFWILVN